MISSKRDRFATYPSVKGGKMIRKTVIRVLILSIIIGLVVFLLSKRTPSHI